MKLHEMNQKIYDLQEEIENHMADATGESHECRIVLEGDTIRITIEGDLEFIEIVMDEFENFYVDVVTPTFEEKLQKELLEYLEELEF
jgi:hypothetical protein